MPHNETYSPASSPIIITRPAPSSQKTAEKIAAMGIDPNLIYQAPLTEITPIPADIQLPSPAIVIITSQHALPAITDYLDKDTDPDNVSKWQFPKWHFYVVGQQTSNRLKALLKDRSLTPSEPESKDPQNITHAANAADLFALIRRAAPDIIHARIPVFYISGQDTHFPMVQSCADIGLTITQIITYCAQPVDIPLAALLPAIENLPDSQNADASPLYILLYSARTCQLFFDGLNVLYRDRGGILQQKNLQFHFLSLSQDITQLAQKLYGESNLYPRSAQYSTAPSPDENALLEKLALIYDKKM